MSYICSCLTVFAHITYVTYLDKKDASVWLLSFVTSRKESTGSEAGKGTPLNYT